MSSILRACALSLALAASAVSAQTTSPAPAAPPPKPPPACAAAEHRQFDFWVGYWDVYFTGKPDKVVANSLIEKLYDGCTIRENWKSKNSVGGSLNMYDPSDKRWHQTWHDSSNSRAQFDGGLVEGKMVLTGFWRGVLGPGDAWMRIEYTPNADGSVRQKGEQSADHGLTWQPSFDFTYRKSSAKPAI